jgi:uncharacterized protein with PQ loop repeat
MAKYELLATAAMAINMISFVTLIRRIHVSKNTSSLSWYYLSGIILAQILFLIYSYANKAYGIFYPTILILSGLLYISFVKFTYTEEVLARLEKEKEEKEK